MKGVGACNPPTPGSRFRDKLLEDFSEQPILPTTLPLSSFVTYPHFGIDARTRLRTICTLVEKIGDITRRFSMAGLFRYSPELSNYEFDFDRAEPVLTDLDSTLDLGARFSYFAHLYRN